MEHTLTEVWDGSEETLNGLMAYIQRFCAQTLPSGRIKVEAFNAHNNKITIHVTSIPEIDAIEELRKTAEALDKHEGDIRFFLIEENRRLEVLGIQVNDSLNLAADVYANKPELAARWLLGQIRNLSDKKASSKASSILIFSTIMSWRGLVDDILKENNAR